ncbi:hypothetical protein [Croceicoccus mobilis]|uniref:Uncharacterized protein n=1 Tax=Croceicoccus mobilis TaxID=1703339 RepID=A0A916Z8L1_9SPHN|nr:hypothetical protein [Croceicoccus mobilis]GGD81863.1 hypothetical protein GCM10010990_34760 [Croceicoccus mobilis]
MSELTLRYAALTVTNINDAVPENDRPVLAIRPSSYNCCAIEVITARYMPAYRPNSPWRDISGDAISDSGSDKILAWAYADNILLPNTR